jgi:hypothetical protein
MGNRLSTEAKHHPPRGGRITINKSFKTIDYSKAAVSLTIEQIAQINSILFEEDLNIEWIKKA